MAFLEANARRIVIKIGTNSLTSPGGELMMDRIRGLCRDIAELHKRGIEVIIISSGAIGMGIRTLGLPSRPSELASLQACAAIGQSRLVQAWQAAMEEVGLIAAQVLLTHEDVRSRQRHLNARHTFDQLLTYKAVPVVNENDTVSTDEIKFGENDVLSALVASLTDADLLVILSTIPGLMKDQGKGELIPVVEKITPEIEAMAGGAQDQFSTGGMVTKLKAARLATQSGCGVFIGSAAEPEILKRIHDGTAPGTFFIPEALSLAARKRWIAFFEKPSGSLNLDAGAVRAVVNSHSSLLAKGITRCRGAFAEGSVVDLRDPDDKLIARGIVRFDTNALEGIIGMDSTEIQKRHPDRNRYEVVHRDSLVVM